MCATSIRFCRRHLFVEPLNRLQRHGLSTEPVPVSAYVGSSKNLKDLKGTSRLGIRSNISPPPNLYHCLQEPPTTVYQPALLPGSEPKAQEAQVPPEAARARGNLEVRNLYHCLPACLAPTQRQPRRQGGRPRQPRRLVGVPGASSAVAGG